MAKSHQIEKTTQLALKRFKAAKNDISDVFDNIEELISDSYLSEGQKYELLDAALEQNIYSENQVKSARIKIGKSEH